MPATKAPHDLAIRTRHTFRHHLFRLRNQRQTAPQVTTEGHRVDELERTLTRIAYRYSGPRMEQADLLQVGRIESWRSESTYDAKKSASLLAHKIACAKRAMLTFAGDHCELIHLPNRARRAGATVPSVISLDVVAEDGACLYSRDFAPFLIECIAHQRARERRGYVSRIISARGPHDGNLTARQVRVLRYVLVEGMEYDAVAAHLKTTPSTVTMDIQTAYEVLKIPRSHRRHAGLVHLYVKAIQRGLLDPIAADGTAPGLCPVELETVRAIAGRYLSQARAASCFGRSLNTINDAVGRVRRKWGVRNALQMYKEAVRRGVINPPDRRA